MRKDFGKYEKRRKIGCMVRASKPFGFSKRDKRFL